MTAPDIQARLVEGELSPREFAVIAHGEQRYGDRPYVEHLDSVAAILTSWGLSGAIVAAGYLHDTLEDTPVTKDQIALRFGSFVSEIVYNVTGEGDTRSAKTASIYRKAGQHRAAALVKVADRIANVEAASSGDHHMARYLDEQEAFAKAFKQMVPLFCWRRLTEALKAKALQDGRDG